MTTQLQRHVLIDDNRIVNEWRDVDPGDNLADAFMVNWLEDDPDLFDKYVGEWLEIRAVSDKDHAINEDRGSFTFALFTERYRVVETGEEQP